MAFYVKNGQKASLIMSIFIKVRLGAEKVKTIFAFMR